MRRQSLSAWLVLTNSGLLLLAALGVTLLAARLLRQQAEAQALARVEQAGRGAQAALAQTGADLAAEAQALAEDVRLLELLAVGDDDSLGDFLTGYRSAQRLDAVAVRAPGQPIAASGAAFDWINAPAITATPAFVAMGDEPALLAAAPLADSSGVVFAIRLLDAAYASDLGAELGVQLSFIAVTAVGENGGELAAMRERAMAERQPFAARLQAEGVYAASVPLPATGDPPVGVITLTLPLLVTNNLIEPAVTSLLALVLVLGGAAAVANLALSRRMSRPMQALAASAERMGLGDLSTPVAAATGAEIGDLASALEDMRRRLLDLTGDLRRQQAESGAILSGIVEGVFTVDRERRIQYLNPQAARLLGQPAEAVLGRFCGDVLRPELRDGRRPCDDQCPIVHARAQSGARATEHLNLPDGQRTMIVATAPPVDMGRPVGRRQQVVVIRDETEVEATRRLRDTVLANISHEFKTPLAAQLASIELLLDQLPDLSTEQIAGLVVSLQSGTVRLTQLIDNLLESVRIEAGQAQVQRKQVALDEVVEHAVELVRPLLDQRGQALTVDLPYPLPPVCGDANRLAQVFVNLLANASKYAPPGSPVRVGGLTTVASVSVWVEDQGPGLPNLPEAALFGRFVRAPGGDAETGGVGLGLWIVKSIVDRHDGQVLAQNTGRGARVRVTLPRLRADEDPGS